MQFNWNDPTAIMFAIYLVAMLGIGAIGYFSTKNLSDYILGGRSLGSFVTALSAGPSDMSGWLLMARPDHLTCPACRKPDRHRPGSWAPT